MTSVRVTVEGSDELLRKLKKLGIGVEQVLEAACMAGAEIVRDDARGLAPGPHVEMDTEKLSRVMAEVAVGPDKEHWYYRFHETGAGAHRITGSPLAFEGREGLVITGGVSHPGMAAQPFLRPAIDGNRDQARDAMGKTWKAVIMREATG